MFDFTHNKPGTIYEHRDRRIDSLRGVFLVIMTIDHFGGYLTKFTQQPLGYVSAAAGFVFISGYVCFQAYGESIDNYRKKLSKTVHRGVKIYKYHIFIVTIIPIISFMIPEYIGYWNRLLGGYYRSPVKTSLGEIFLVHQPKYMDILPMYFVFLILCPLLFFLLEKQKTKQILVFSFSLWAAGNFFNPIEFLDNCFSTQFNPGFFNIFSWQFVFVLGVIVSKHRRSLLKKIENRFMLFSLFGLNVLFFYFRHLDTNINDVLVLARSDFPAFRLLNFAVLCPLVAFCLTRFPRSAFLPFFEYLGRYSLQIYTIHILLIYFLLPFDWRIRDQFGPYGYSTYVVCAVLCLAILMHFYNTLRRLWKEGSRDGRFATLRRRL